MEIEIISKEEVKPASPTPPHLRTFRLSLLDQLARHEYSNLVYFFAPMNQSTMLNDVISKEVYHTDAQVSIRLSDFLKESENELINRLGIAVGLSTSQKIVDGLTMIKFLNAWAAIACESSEQINPIFVSSSFFRQVPPCTSNYSKLVTGMSTVLSKRQLYEHNYATKILFFDHLALDVLKTKAGTSSLNPTSVTAVMGLLWKSAIAASQVRSDTQKELSLLISVNLRTRCSR
ncbi:epi-neemfruitin B 7-O-acetyltransferse L7AT-like [Coffea arabica]|uniref:Epi-neemfruitin B 7-O-acetyltransferse L7AT-like n=1 Tax=Coffea arabica TaxID=13443 RepID=A0ABM4U0X6_COFAR